MKHLFYHIDHNYEMKDMKHLFYHTDHNYEMTDMKHLSWICRFTPKRTKNNWRKEDVACKSTLIPWRKRR